MTKITCKNIGAGQFSGVRLVIANSLNKLNKCLLRLFGDRQIACMAISVVRRRSSHFIYALKITRYIYDLDITVIQERIWG